MDVSPATHTWFDLARRVQDLVLDGRSSLGHSDADQWRILALARFELLRALEALTLYKARVLLPIIQASDPGRGKIAMEMLDRNRDLQREYESFINRWRMTSPTSVDEIYKVEAGRMASRIEEQVNEDVRTVTALVG